MTPLASEGSLTGIHFTRFTSLSLAECCAGSPKQLSGRQTDPSPLTANGVIHVIDTVLLPNE